jgi:7-cyano-7-deazaguanine synthase in queuosine biosynthesis
MSATVGAYHPSTFDFVAHADGRLQLSGNGTGVKGDGRYYVDDKPVADALSNWIPPELSDLLDVAVAVYLADRLARRTAVTNQYEHHWQREMRVTVPVRAPTRWNSPEVHDALTAALRFLTEDNWRFGFTQRAPGRSRPAEDIQFLFPEELAPPVIVALFSGGLDSLAGLAADIETNAAASIVLVSANTNTRVLPVQRALVEQLRERTDKKIVWTTAHFGLRRRKARQYESEERTQRTRGFAFTAVGAVAAIVAGAGSLRLYENGVGAINLPYIDSQLGAQSTRAMHPAAILLIEELIQVACGHRLPLELPNLYRTKGELCASLARSNFANLATATISCDSYPLRKPGAKQCGICTSCLLRRQALLAGSIRDDLGARDLFGYRLDIYRRFATLSADKRLPVQAMLGQARRIRQAVGTSGNDASLESWNKLVRAFPALLDLPDTLNDGERIALVEMYARYGEEFAQFDAAIPRSLRQSAAAARLFA